MTTSIELLNDIKCLIKAQDTPNLDVEVTHIGCMDEATFVNSGSVFLETIYNSNGSVNSEQIIGVEYNGTVTRPYTTPFISCDKPNHCCFTYEACAELAGDEVVVNVFEIRNEGLHVISQRLELPDGTDVTATATLAACGECCGVEGCLTFGGFDYYGLGDLDPAGSSTFEILVDNAIVATTVTNFVTTNTGNKSSWYADVVAAVAANTNWEMSVHTDALASADGPKVIWNLEYDGPGDETLEIRYVTGFQSHVFNIDSAGAMTNSVIDQGTAMPEFGTPQFNEVPCNV